jgi:hypothetical protein
MGHIKIAPKTINELIDGIESSTNTGTKFTVLHLDGFEAEELLRDLKVVMNGYNNFLQECADCDMG